MGLVILVGAYMKDGIHIVLSPEHITTWMGIPITNTLVTAWVVMAILIVMGVIIGYRAKLVPTRFQTTVETLFGFVLDYMEDTLESRKLALKFFPLLMTLFLFIMFANLFEWIPGVGSIGFTMVHDGVKEFVALFRPVNTDLNVTLALAIISFIVIEVVGVVTIGFWKYLGKFFRNPFKEPLQAFIGIVEFFSEIIRLVSFSFRLFGNIFAGKVLVLVAIFFVPYILPVPLMLFEVFVGVIQAAIFALLTLFFIKIAITEPH